MTCLPTWYDKSWLMRPNDMPRHMTCPLHSTFLMLVTLNGQNLTRGISALRKNNSWANYCFPTHFCLFVFAVSVQGLFWEV